MLSAKHLPVWNVSLPSTLGQGSLAISVSHLAACRPLPNFIASCLGTERDSNRVQNPTLSIFLSSLTTDKGSMLCCNLGDKLEESYFNQVLEHQSM